MPLADFLLASHGRAEVTVGHPALEPPQPDVDVEAAVRSLDADARLACPGRAPALDTNVAVWAARTIYAFAQAMTYRDLDDAFLDGITAMACPAMVSPSACWSADLSFCLLPDLHRLAAAASHDDPLTVALLGLAKRWPLSSAGVPGVGPVDVSGWIEHDALRHLYVDRVLERGDVSRLESDDVKALAGDALGGHRQLSPLVAMGL